MNIYFVIDIKGGKVVAGKSGERDKYEEIHKMSVLVDRSDVESVIDRVRPRNLYVADLDRIMGIGDNIPIIEKLNVKRLIADCGFRSLEETKKVNFIPVIGTETFNILELRDGNYIVSVDFKGNLLDRSGKFKNLEEILEYLNSFKLAGVLVLPIHSVGTMKYDFSLLEKALKISDHKILTGGGFKSLNDLYKAKDLGVDGVLIATAVHRGLIDVEIVRKGKI
uniref:HisA/HisF family protein n=1 Tax=Geoglobus ahangari TaxID=113653 RepID=A0A7C3UBT1_9EURY